MDHRTLFQNIIRFLGIAAIGTLIGLSGVSAVHSANVYPRLISPNGDGINDFVFFVLENNTGAPAQGAIYNAQMLKVADVRESTVFMLNRTILLWDGKDESGAVVNAGIYIYKVQVGNDAFTGTVGVVR